MYKYRVSRKLRLEVLKKTNGFCYYCYEELPPDITVFEEGHEIMTVSAWDCDHVVPVSAGGKTTLDNLVPSCKRCNRIKSNKVNWIPPNTIRLEAYIEAN